MTAPVAACIETARLRLAPPVIGDFEEIWAMHREPRVAQFLSQVMGANGPDDAWRKLLRNIGHWTAFGFGMWSVRAQADGAYVGEVGFGFMRRGLGPGFDPFPEAGWILAPRWQGQGLASEAVRAVHAWLAVVRPGRVVCMIAPGNAPSLLVAARLGYAAFAETAYKEKPVTLLAREEGADV